MNRLLPILCIALLPSYAFAHPHDKPETSKKSIDEIRTMLHSDGMKDDRSEKIKKRIVVKKMKDGDKSQWTSDDKNVFVFKGDAKSETQMIDLGEGMKAKIHGEEVYIINDGKMIGSTVPDDMSVDVDKSVTIEDGRKKTKIVIKLDAPAE